MRSILNIMLRATKIQQTCPTVTSSHSTLACLLLTVDCHHITIKKEKTEKGETTHRPTGITCMR